MKAIHLSSIVLASTLAVSATSCAISAEDPELGITENDLVSSTSTPIQGECTTTKSINLATAADGSDVIRGACTVTCKKKASQVGIWNLAVDKPGGTVSSTSNLGPGTSRSAQVDVPFAPGTYAVSCVGMWQEKSNSTHFFGSNGPYLSITF